MKIISSASEITRKRKPVMSPSGSQKLENYLQVRDDADLSNVIDKPLDEYSAYGEISDEDDLHAISLSQRTPLKVKKQLNANVKHGSVKKTTSSKKAKQKTQYRNMEVVEKELQQLAANLEAAESFNLEVNRASKTKEIKPDFIYEENEENIPLRRQNENIVATHKINLNSGKTNKNLDRRKIMAEMKPYQTPASKDYRVAPNSKHILVTVDVHQDASGGEIIHSQVVSPPGCAEPELKDSSNTKVRKRKSVAVTSSEGSIIEPEDEREIKCKSFQNESNFDCNSTVTNCETEFSPDKITTRRSKSMPHSSRGPNLYVQSTVKKTNRKSYPEAKSEKCSKQRAVDRIGNVEMLSLQKADLSEDPYAFPLSQESNNKKKKRQKRSRKNERKRQYQNLEISLRNVEPSSDSVHEMCKLSETFGEENKQRRPGRNTRSTNKNQNRLTKGKEKDVFDLTEIVDMGEMNECNASGARVAKAYPEEDVTSVSDISVANANKLIVKSTEGHFDDPVTKKHGESAADLDITLESIKPSSNSTRMETVLENTMEMPKHFSAEGNQHHAVINTEINVQDKLKVVGAITKSYEVEDTHKVKTHQEPINEEDSVTVIGHPSSNKRKLEPSRPRKKVLRLSPEAVPKQLKVHSKPGAWTPGREMSKEFPVKVKRLPLMKYEKVDRRSFQTGLTDLEELQMERKENTKISVCGKEECDQGHTSKQIEFTDNSTNQSEGIGSTPLIESMSSSYCKHQSPSLISDNFQGSDFLEKQESGRRHQVSCENVQQDATRNLKGRQNNLRFVKLGVENGPGDFPPVGFTDVTESDSCKKVVTIPASMDSSDVVTPTVAAKLVEKNELFNSSFANVHENSMAKINTGILGSVTASKNEVDFVGCSSDLEAHGGYSEADTCEDHSQVSQLYQTSDFVIVSKPVSKSSSNEEVIRETEDYGENSEQTLQTVDASKVIGEQSIRNTERTYCTNLKKTLPSTADYTPKHSNQCKLQTLLNSTESIVSASVKTASTDNIISVHLVHQQSCSDQNKSGYFSPKENPSWKRNDVGSEAETIYGEKEKVLIDVVNFEEEKLEKLSCYKSPLSKYENKITAQSSTEHLEITSANNLNSDSMEFSICRPVKKTEKQDSESKNEVCQKYTDTQAFSVHKHDSQSEELMPQSLTLFDSNIETGKYPVYVTPSKKDVGSLTSIPAGLNQDIPETVRENRIEILSLDDGSESSKCMKLENRENEVLKTANYDNDIKNIETTKQHSTRLTRRLFKSNDSKNVQRETIEKAVSIHNITSCRNNISSSDTDSLSSDEEQKSTVIKRCTSSTKRGLALANSPYVACNTNEHIARKVKLSLSINKEQFHHEHNLMGENKIDVSCREQSSPSASESLVVISPTPLSRHTYSQYNDKDCLARVLANVKADLLLGQKREQVAEIVSDYGKIMEVPCKDDQEVTCGGKDDYSLLGGT